MAQQAITQLNSNTVISAIDARMSEVYFAVYNNVNGLAQLQDKEIVKKPELLEPVQITSATAVGTGWQTYEQLLFDKFACQRSEIYFPSAEFMLPLAIADIQQGKVMAAEFAQPNYVRDEVSWQKLPGR
jgi:tRNA threonylcarbamoyladenosine biosynthesis protein TsaB